MPTTTLATPTTETIVGTWQAPPWADSADFYRAEVEHIRSVQAPDNDEISAFLCVCDAMERGDTGEVRVMRGPVQVSVICPSRLTAEFLPRWDEFTVEQARCLTAADLPGIDADAWPAVQGVVTELLAIYDAAVMA